MEPGKPRKIKTALRQRLSYRLILATGLSVALITAVLIIYFQFFRNEVTNAKSIPVLTNGTMPVDMVVTQNIVVNSDTLSNNGSRYRIAKPLKNTPAR